MIGTTRLWLRLFVGALATMVVLSVALAPLGLILLGEAFLLLRFFRPAA